MGRDESAGKEESLPEIDNETVRRWVAIRRKYLWHRRVAKFFELSHFAWFFDEFPSQEMYRNVHVQRNTRQELQRHWLRQRSGWTYLSKLKSTAGAKFAAAAGVVSAAFQAAPNLHGASKGTPFKWLLMAGVCYLSAVLWYEVFSPLLLKQVLSSKDEQLGAHGRRWMRALVEDELRRWWVKREWVPHPGSIDPEITEHTTALAILSSDRLPAFAGFDAYACAHIEQALAEFGRIEKIGLWRAPEQHGDELVRFSPVYAYEGSRRPLVQCLSIRHPDPAELEAEASMSTQDLVIAWWDANIELSDWIPNRRNIQIDRQAQGITYLFETDAHANAFARAIAHWQDTLHPLRRAVLLALYFGSALFFLLFVIAQMFVTFAPK